MIRQLHPGLLLYSLLFSALFSCTPEQIAVRDAWILEPPPRSPAAGYLTIINHGTDPIELVRVETNVAERTEIHVMDHKDGRMTMRRATGVTVPGHDEVVLKSGGTHLMLINLRRQLQAGEQVAFVLQFADSTEKRVEAQVRKGGYATD
jgi:copper(I)-binding protein